MFTLRGIGTVATGTLWSGEVAAGTVLRAEPAGRDVRVRSVQVHDRDVDVAAAGQRVAVSLPGVDRDELRRGDVLVAARRVQTAAIASTSSSRSSRRSPRVRSSIMERQSRSRV